MPIVAFGNLSLPGGSEEIAITDATARLISEQLLLLGDPNGDAAARTLKPAIESNGVCRPSDDELAAIEAAIDNVLLTLTNLRASIVQRRDALEENA